MLRRFLPLILLAAQSALGAVAVDDSVAESDTTSDNNGPLTESGYNLPGTSDALLVFLGGQDNSDTQTAVWNTSETLSEVGAAEGLDATGDTYVKAFCLLSPTDTTADVVTDWVGNSDANWMVTIALSGVSQTDCASVMVELAEDVDTGGTSNTAVFASAGSAGNMGFVACSGVGGDSSPMSNDAGFTELFDTATGVAVNPEDLGYMVAYGALPDAVTVTLSATDEHACVYMSVAAAGGSGFDSTPVVASQTTTAYTVTGSLGGAGDVYGVACLKDQTAPSIAQVSAGDCTGDVTAQAADSDSPASGDFDFSLTLTPSTRLEVFDLYVTDGTTLTTLADELLDPLSDCGTGGDELCAQTILTSIDSASPIASLNAGLATTVDAGDVVIYPRYTSPGIAGTHNGSNNDTRLTDTAARDWIADEWIGSLIQNTTDGSECVVTDNDTTTITCTLSGGTDDDWDVGDAYKIRPKFTVADDGHFSYPDDGLEAKQSGSGIYFYDTSAGGYHE